MGDRGNIVVQDGSIEKRIYLYAHWQGEYLPQILYSVLRRRERWGDASYLTRMIFCAMVKGYEDKDTGWGISTELGDNEHPLIIVNPEESVIWFEDEDGKQLLKPMAFEQYLKRYEAFEGEGEPRPSPEYFVEHA